MQQEKEHELSNGGDYPGLAFSVTCDEHPAVQGFRTAFPHRHSRTNINNCSCTILIATLQEACRQQTRPQVSKEGMRWQEVAKLLRRSKTRHAPPPFLRELGQTTVTARIHIRLVPLRKRRYVTNSLVNHSGHFRLQATAPPPLLFCLTITKRTRT